MPNKKKYDPVPNGLTKVFENDLAIVYHILDTEAARDYEDCTYWEPVWSMFRMNKELESEGLLSSPYPEPKIYFIFSKNLPKRHMFYKVFVVVGGNGAELFYDRAGREVSSEVKDLFHIPSGQCCFLSKKHDLRCKVIFPQNISADGNMYNGDIIIPEDLVKNGKLQIPYFEKVNGDFKCILSKLTTLEGCPKSVTGDFTCAHNRLITLKHSPQSVGGSFSCSNNNLSTLEGSPTTIGFSFTCTNNQLTSLKGSPQSVGGNFNCPSNQLTSLKGGPQFVGGNFNCPSNQLTSLKGGPQFVGNGFFCYSNKLNSLRYCPKNINGFFNCMNNQLTSLKGSPKSVGGDFNCRYNQLTTLKYSPHVSGDIICDHNKFTEEEEVKALCKVKGVIHA